MPYVPAAGRWWSWRRREGLAEAARALGLGRALGYVRMLQLGPDDLTTLPEPG